MRKFTGAGQSLVELIVAVSIFMVISASTVIAVLGSLSSSRLAEEETQAVFYASQGLGAVRSIRNRGWSDPFLAVDCTSTTCGLTKSGTWSFVGGADDPDGTGKYLREISVENVEHDINGDFVASGGVVDSEAKRVISRVKWDFTSGRSNQVELTTVLTNWQTSVKQNTCADYCLNNDYSQGACRRNEPECKQNNEQYAILADQYCTASAQEDTCCCLP